MLDEMSKTKFSRNEKLLTIVCAVFLVAFLFVTFFRSFHPFDVEVNNWISSNQSSPLTIINEGFAVVFDTASLVRLSLILPVIFS